jgi:protein disulfide isomerase family A protein 5
MYEINSVEGFFKEVAGRTDNKLVIVKFYVDWCGYCKMIKPEYVKLANATPNADFYQVNTEHNEDIAKLVNVSGIPVFMAFRKGKLLKRVDGANKSGMISLAKL